MKRLNLEEYDSLVKKCREIAINKNNDYGCESQLKFGVIGNVIRMYDKIERLVNLTYYNKDRKVIDEKLEDTALDLVNYALYTVMLLRGKLSITENDNETQSEFYEDDSRFYSTGVPPGKKK